ncbi:hypothetical protein AGMMS49938_11340 [Fibrobacterales bacterium]|nr:hypothetical protein AGMMS49938_11340 [Fibrobacterales bacterium]
MPNVTKNDLINGTALICGSFRSDAKNVIEQFFSLVGESVGEGRSLELRGFGTFSMKHCGSRNGRNLQTGELIPLAPHKSVNFKFSQDLKEKIGDKIEVKEKFIGANRDLLSSTISNNKPTTAASINSPIDRRKSVLNEEFVSR